MSAKEEKVLTLVPPPSSSALDPEMRAHISRLMSGYEQAHRVLAEFAESMMAQVRSSNEATAKALEMQLRLAEEREELISRRHRREIETEESKQRQQGFAEIGRDLRALLTLGGKKALGVPLTGDDSHGLQDFLKQLSSEQFDALMTTGTLQLSPPQRMLVGGIIQSFAEAERKKLEAEKPSEPAKTDEPKTPDAEPEK